MTSKPGGSSLTREQCGSYPVYCPHGVRHEGSMTLLWASVRNVGTCGSNAKGETQIGSPYKSESTEVEPRDGLPRSSNEVPVMGMERRGQVTRLALVANREREELQRRVQGCGAATA